MFLIFMYNMFMVYFIAYKLIEISIASSLNLLKCILSDYIHVENLTNIQVISIETSYAVSELNVSLYVNFCVVIDRYLDRPLSAGIHWVPEFCRGHNLGGE